VTPSGSVTCTGPVLMHPEPFVEGDLREHRPDDEVPQALASDRPPTAQASVARMPPFAALAGRSS